MSIEHADRYLSHCEDEPYFKTSRHCTVGEAVAATIRCVTDRLQRNGCGNGLIYDRHDQEIVAIYGHIGNEPPDSESGIPVVGLIPSPNEGAQSRMKALAIAWDDALESKTWNDFIWPTLSG